MAMEASLKREMPWTWEKEFKKYSSNKNGSHPGAAPVSAFRNKKVLLSEHWDEISVIGTVGEMDLDADLHNIIVSSSHPNKTCTLDDKAHSQKNAAPKYWFVKIVQFEGYFTKVRFLGYAPEQTLELSQYDKWISYHHLQEIGFYKYDGTAVLPQIPLKPSLNGDAIMTRLYSQIINKPTVNPMRIEWMRQGDKLNKWRVGSKVEVRNRDCCSEMRCGFVNKTCGPRVEVLYYDETLVDRRVGTWVDEDSDFIQLPGWTKTVGGKLFELGGYNPVPLEPSKLGVDTNVNIHIKVGMLFEFINPIRLDEIAVGKVTKVLSYGYFNCCIESRVLDVDVKNFVKGVNEFHFHITSDNLFPLGTFCGETPSPRPTDALGKGNFQWESYLKQSGLEALPLPQKLKKDAFVEIKESMWVEAVDTHRPELICPAFVLKVKPFALKVRFLGWGPQFDQWKTSRSGDIFPIGWCQLNNYPLESPPSITVEHTPTKLTKKKPKAKTFPSQTKIPKLVTAKRNIIVMNGSETQGIEDMKNEFISKNSRADSDIQVSPYIDSPLKLRAKAEFVNDEDDYGMLIAGQKRRRRKSNCEGKTTWEQKQYDFITITGANLGKSKADPLYERSKKARLSN